MSIRYEFVNGDILEVEVPEHINEVSLEIDRKIYNNNRKETRRHSSLDNLQDEYGLQFGDTTANVEQQVVKREENTIVHEAIEKLLPQQKELVQKVFFEDLSMAEIAREEGVTAKAIQNRINKIKRKLRKIIEKNLG